MKKFFAWILTLVAFFYILFVIIKNQNVIFKKYDPKISEKKYYQSQWAIPNSKNPISDEELYAYAGYRYIKGANPILVNPEAPPLGKYIMGLSIMLFNNYRILAIFSAFLVLVLIFFLAGPIGIFLTAINTLFIDQIIHSGQNDIYQALFLLAFIFLYSLYLEKKKNLYILLSGIAFGAFISIKVFVLYYFLFNAWILLFYLMRKFPIKKIIVDLFILNIVALITFALTYIQYFLHQGSLRGFLGVQKWIYLFYSSSQIDRLKLLGNYLNLAFFNRWRFWSTGYTIVRYENWSILWPIVFIVGLLACFKLFFSKSMKSNIVVLLISFFLVYNLFLLIIPVFPRYLLLLFIPLNVFISVYFGKILNKYV